MNFFPLRRYVFVSLGLSVMFFPDGTRTATAQVVDPSGRGAPPRVASPQTPRQAPNRTASAGPANSGQQQKAGSQAARQQSTAPAQKTNPLNLTPAQLKRLDQLLTYWESRSNGVKTFSCEFVRYEYDSVFGPKDPKQAKTKSEGVIRYASPDKGEFRVDKAWEFKAAANDPGAGGLQKSTPNEHWICDGKSVYELNSEKKQLIQQELPPELQGKKIAEGPLPFLFGAEKSTLNRRYWIREIQPPDGRDVEYWFEAYPKTREDASNYQKLTVILEAKNFLPTALQVFPPNYDARTNPSRTVYTFTNRKVDDVGHQARQFFNRFISPRTPLGWKKVVSQFGAPGPAAQTARQATNQAQRPTTNPAKR